jgi:hypothetical protein
METQGLHRLRLSLEQTLTITLNRFCQQRRCQVQFWFLRVAMFPLH